MLALLIFNRIFLDFTIFYWFSHGFPMVFGSLGDGGPVAVAVAPQELRWRRCLAKAFRELRRSEHVKAALEVAAPGVMATWSGAVGWRSQSYDHMV